MSLSGRAGLMLTAETPLSSLSGWSSPAERQNHAEVAMQQERRMPFDEVEERKGKRPLLLSCLSGLPEQQEQ